MDDLDQTGPVLRYALIVLISPLDLIDHTGILAADHALGLLHE
jgi:hypothetical protein